MYAASLFVAIIARAAAVCAAPASSRTTELSLKTAVVEWRLSRDGTSQSLRERRDGRELLAARGRPFASVVKEGRDFPATSLAGRGPNYRVAFGASGVSADFHIADNPGYVIVKLLRLHGPPVQLVRLVDLTLAPMKYDGEFLAVRSNDRLAIALLGLSDKVKTGFVGAALSASVQKEFGIEQQGVALLATTAPGFLRGVQRVERDFRLPSPSIGGRWAKESAEARSSYLFIDLTEANAEEVIRYAKLGGFRYVMIYADTWSSSWGSYPVNLRNFPRGEAGLRAVVDRLHANGLKAGVHILTSFIGKTDPLVQPQPDRRLLKDAQAILGTELDEKSTSIVATGSMTAFPLPRAYRCRPALGTDIQIDDEILRCHERGASSNQLTQCARGQYGTQAARHRKGSRVEHLFQRYNAYLADLRTSLKDLIADRVAGLVDRLGFDMIFFDGGEVNAANGPDWYWVAQQQSSILRRIRRPVLAQGSGLVPWLWHSFARMGCDDYAAIGRKAYLDYYKVGVWRRYARSFMPAELGWWGVFTTADSYMATLPDEVEHYGSRMLALNAPGSIETYVGILRANGRTDELLSLHRRYELLRLAGRVPNRLRRRLISGEWMLQGGVTVPRVAPVKYLPARVRAAESLRVPNPFGAQPLQFRIAAVPTLAAVGDGRNKTLFRPTRALKLEPPRADAAVGALAARVEFSRLPGMAVDLSRSSGVLLKCATVDLSRHRALAVALTADGPAVAAGLAVLNVQLETASGTFRDHYIDLHARGERTVVLAQPDADRLLTEFIGASNSYPVKAALYSNFDYGQVIAVNLRWMRVGVAPPPRYRVKLIEALAERETPLEAGSVGIGGVHVALPQLKPGEYAELMNGRLRLFDRNSRELASGTPQSVPQLQHGENIVAVGGRGWAKLTVIVADTPIPLRPGRLPFRGWRGGFNEPNR